jgi:hypothetical protein
MPRKTNTAPAAEVEVTEEVTTLTAKEMAAELGTDAKSFRRFLRGITDARANKGGRWIFTPEAAEAIRTAYAARDAKGTEPTLPEADDAAE